MERKIRRILVGLMGLTAVLTGTRLAEARTWYNFPSHSKVKITRDPNGQSWIYVEFKWDEACPPNFEKGKAVEFEVGITPKCFLQPKGGKDNNFFCNDVMGFGKYNIPNNYITEIDAYNCYIDLWNYWNPPADEVVQELHANCGFDSSGDWCAEYVTNTGAFLDPIGNFAVGLHDASALQAGVLYSFRYPVEINDSPECLNINTTYPSARQCASDPPIMEDQFVGYYTPSNVVTYLPIELHPGWGRAQITMQTFNNSCDLPAPCDWVNTAYTCPHLIGAVGAGSGCIDADKHTDFWLNRLCVPTSDWEFTPGYGTKVATSGCATEQNSGDLYTHDACCLDLDGDSYYGPTGYNDGGDFIPVDVYGSSVKDCNDSDNAVHPHATEVCSDGKDNDCDGVNGCFLGPPIGICPDGSECTPGDQYMSLCPNGVDAFHQVCTDQCVWETVSVCPSDDPCAVNPICQPNQTVSQSCSAGGIPGEQTKTCTDQCAWGPWSVCEPTGSCSPGQTAECGNCGYKTCGSTGQWGTCLNEGVCTPGQTQNQNCNGTGTQTKTCTSQCVWSSWSACSVPCQDVYLASSSSACFNNPGTSGTPTVCLNVQQVSGATWKFQVCRQSGTFQNDFSVKLKDDNYSMTLGGPYANVAGNQCSQWHDFSVSHISGYGVSNGAAVKAEIKSPVSCSQSSCTYSTGLITIRKEC